VGEREREAVIALSLTCIFMAAAVGRARQALWRLGHDRLGGVQVSTGVKSQGVFGALVGRASSATLTMKGGRLEQFRLPYVESVRVPALIRRVELRWADVTIGRFGRLQARAAISDVMLDGESVVWEADARVRGHARGEAVVTATAADLALEVEHRLPSARSVQVALLDGHVVLRALAGGAAQPITATARLQVAENAVYIADVHAWQGGMALLPAMSNAIASAVNPVFRLADFPALGDGFVLRDVAVGEGVARLVLDIRPRSRAALRQEDK